MKKILLLSGYACSSWIWHRVKDAIGDTYELDIIDWPKERLREFSRLQHFVDWLQDALEADAVYDLVIGHSMGGLIAAYLAEQDPDRTKAIAFVEAFIVSPGEFFQNLIYEEDIHQIKGAIGDMMAEEGQYYSKALIPELREVALESMIKNIEADVYAIYGDRGSGSYDKERDALAWNMTTIGKIALNIVGKSCHFPMLENPDAFIRHIQRIINDYDNNHDIDKRVANET